MSRPWRASSARTKILPQFEIDFSTTSQNVFGYSNVEQIEDRGSRIDESQLYRRFSILKWIDMPRRHPDWIKVKAPGNPNYLRLKRLMREKNLHTVCEEARCPNIGECWGNKTATFLILGDTCTRGCRFCAIDKGKPLALDPEEPRNVALVVKDLGLDHIVVTSVNRDDLPDGGAAHFAQTVFWIKQFNPSTRVELLVPDFAGNLQSLETVVNSGIRNSQPQYRNRSASIRQGPPGPQL